MIRLDLKDAKIAVLGLGYVGLPLALAFAKKYPVLGFDVNPLRISELLDGYDKTGEATPDDIKQLLTGDTLKPGSLNLSASQSLLADCNVYVITVPTPVDRLKVPDLGPLLYASALVGRVLNHGDIVIYESTVYPGCTEEDCVPVLENSSNLKFNEHFFCGYSPERINPGDKVRTLTNIVKVTSGSTPCSADFINRLYASIITAGTYLAPSIKVAEASKAIENAQRDVNISFVNELALIFDLIGIDTHDVLAAAGTKWNFLPFKPGLVGGHCIGVDPFYLAYKAKSLGYHPEVILSGRRVNDNMGVFVANKVVKLMLKKGHKITGSKALILGFTFKENCPDIRNSRVIDIYTELTSFGITVDVSDPYANPNEVFEQFRIHLMDINAQTDNSPDIYDAIILAVAHQEFLTFDLRRMVNENTVVFDTKAVLDRNIVDARL